MRLLNIHDLTFREFVSGSIEKYAIASHRWITGTEATLKDVQKRKNQDKAGYGKVVGFAEYVKSNVQGVDWLWMDTCCLDQKSSQEVSEGVNSMFRWYAGAEVCLAYLADVQTTDPEDFVKSSWFSRGWTLQELLAPAAVLFLTKDWNIIGHKGQADSLVKCSVALGPALEAQIAVATGISENVLRNYDESRSLGVDDKLIWMEGRETSRPEDMWYSLCGILDVAIIASYGEGVDKARKRLLEEITDVSVSIVTARDKLIESLYFETLDDRRDHIQLAYHDTYQWALSSSSSPNNAIGSLATWLTDPQPRERIYWISGKPGAGKSSLMRFLDESLDDLSIPSKSPRVRSIKVQHYFWNAGNALRKSSRGLLRTILYELLRNAPDLFSTCAALRHKLSRMTVQSAANQWSFSDLRKCVTEGLSGLSPSAHVLILVDGLDEIDGGQDAHIELIATLRVFAKFENVKLCVSSRPWTVFLNAFVHVPHIRLEDLNKPNIEAFVSGELSSIPRYQQLLKSSFHTVDLVNQVAVKAEGVFLWARLVVKEIVRLLQDGDDLNSLERTIDSIPEDLGEYFNRLLGSLEPRYQREASVILQVALFTEEDFITLHPLRLFDLVFISDVDTDFAVQGHHSSYVQSLNGPAAFCVKLESTLRVLNSRCKGLLECHYCPEETPFDHGWRSSRNLYALPEQAESDFNYTETPLNAFSDTVAEKLHSSLNAAFDFSIDFLHRSLRDWLLEPHIQNFLHGLTGGPIDGRRYLRNVRTVEALLCLENGIRPEITAGLLSHILCSLSVRSFRDDTRCTKFAPIIQHIMDKIHPTLIDVPENWYTHDIFAMWEKEQSNFVSLAIDFALTGFLAQTLTADMVRQKGGRPLLDYTLQPGFSRFIGDIGIGNQYPDPGIVRLLLRACADPNEMYRRTTVWHHYLRSMVREPAVNWVRHEDLRLMSWQTLLAMIEGGADTVKTIRARAKDTSFLEILQILEAYFPVEVPALINRLKLT